MPEWARVAFVLVIGSWSIWYFSRLVWVGLRTGNLVDSNPWDGRPVTRETKPVAFWFSMVLGAILVAGFIWLIGDLIAELLGLWDSAL